MTRHPAARHMLLWLLWDSRSAVREVSLAVGCLLYSLSSFLPYSPSPVLITVL